MKDLLFKLFVLLAVAVFIPGCGEEEAEESCNFVQNSYKQRVAWTASQLPIRFNIHESVPAKFHADIFAAAAEWNSKSPNQKLIEVTRYTVRGNLNPVRDGRNLITWNRNWVDNKDTDQDERKTEQGRTTIHWSNDTIFESDIIVNANISYVAEYQFAFGNVVRFKALMNHEMGHALGLAHNEHQDSVMNRQLDYAVDRNLKGHVDIESLSCEYESVHI